MVRDLFQLKFLEGRRTQVAAVAIAVLTLLLQFGVITPEQHTTIIGLLTSIGLVTASVHKNGDSHHT